MGRINQCPISPPSGLPEIEPYEISSSDDPLPFRNLEEFERWLRDEYIFRMIHSTTFYGTYNVECLGIFSPNRAFERCCLQYARNIGEYSRKFQNLLRNKIISHNHPSGQLFSRSDIFTWAELQMQETRVITPLNVGEYRMYSIKRLHPGRPTWDEIMTIINTQDPGLINFDSNPNYRHRCLLLLNEQGLIEYSVDPPIHEYVL